MSALGNDNGHSLSAAAKRVDLHCHSDASNKAAEVLLNAIACPECYSRPDDVHAQAKRRGMDFVTLTDHDSIEGAQRMANGRSDVLIGEELTCWFPEDDCKMHVLVWGITPVDHQQLQNRAKDIYTVAEYIETHQIAHAVAHPIYRQNDRLERWHLERLLLMFKGFECINGAHSALHRDAFEPLLDTLSRNSLAKLSAKHNLPTRWPSPWIKSRTAGSDDHGLLNIGRTYTEFPPDTQTVADVLQCIRDGTCKPGGESGSATKLAHTFFGVAVRYYTREILEKNGGSPNLPTQMLQMIVGEKAMPSKAELISKGVAYKLKKMGQSVLRPFNGQGDSRQGTALLRGLFVDSLKSRIGQYPRLRQALEQGLPPLGEHDEMLKLVSNVNRDVMQGIARAVGQSIDDSSFTGLFDAISSILGQQFVLTPYYFALFHQNRERHLLRGITGIHRPLTNANIKIGLFTDTFDEINGVGRFLRDLSGYAVRNNRSLVVHTCNKTPTFDAPSRKNFEPLLSREMPYYPELQMNFPPILEILDWADRQQFDVIHSSTPGPMGIVGMLVAKMLRIPLLGTYHTDFPAYVQLFTKDHRASHVTTVFMEYFYSQFAAVFTRSRSYLLSLQSIGVSENRSRVINPGVDSDKFHPGHRDLSLWQKLGVKESRRLIYAGRVSVEKNLPLLVDVFKELNRNDSDVALIVAGTGPYLETMRKELAGLPVYFLGYQNDAQLGPLYASADLLVFPSRTDTLGQVVMEAQASGLPAVVSNEGGPKEVIEPGVTGLALPATTSTGWGLAIASLLHDEPQRQRMSRAAISRMERFSFTNMFDGFWAEHVAIADKPVADEDAAESPTPEGVLAADERG